MKVAIVERFRKQEYAGGLYYMVNANIRMFNDNGVVLLPVSSILEKDFILENADALYVPGGADVDPKYYHENMDGSVGCFDFIDELDLAYIDLFYKAKKPILGVCKGLQILNVYFGGSLYQDIKGHNDGIMHNVKVVKDSFVYDLYKEENIMVNSYHHQAIKELGSGLKPVAYSDEGYIEAFSGDNVYAVQWHPELYDKDRFISYFINKIF